jgi:hypothetical protein
MNALKIAFLLRNLPMEFLQNCPGSQSLLHTNEFPEFWNEYTLQRRYEPFSRTHSRGYPKRQWEPHSPIA